MKTHYFGFCDVGYGLTVKPLGICENFDEADEAASKCGVDIYWILPENDLRAFQGSIQNELTKLTK